MHLSPPDWGQRLLEPHNCASCRCDIHHGYELRRVTVLAQLAMYNLSPILTEDDFKRSLHDRFNARYHRFRSSVAKKYLQSIGTRLQEDEEAPGCIQARFYSKRSRAHHLTTSTVTSWYVSAETEKSHCQHPPELRNQIYEYVLSSQHRHIELFKSPVLYETWIHSTSAWFQTMKPSQVCRQMRHEYRPLALRQQELTISIKPWLRYVDFVYGPSRPVEHVPRRVDLIIEDPLVERLRLDALPLLRIRHCESSAGRSASISFRPCHDYLKQPTTMKVQLDSILGFDDPRWVTCIGSGDVAEVVIHAGRGSLDYGVSIVRVVVVFKSGKAPGRLTSEVIVPEVMVRDEGFVDKFAESVGWTKRKGLDVHASIEGHCKNVWPLRPTKYLSRWT